LKARNADLTAERIVSRIENNATDLGEPGRDDTYGYGLLNARCAVAPSSDRC